MSDSSGRGSSWFASSGERLTAALEQYGESMTKRASAHVAKQREAEQQQQQQQGTENTKEKAAPEPAAASTMTNDDNKNTTSSNSTAAAEISSSSSWKNRPGSEVLGKLQLGWGSVVEATKQAVEATVEAVEKEAQKYASNKQRVQKRDLSLPLDVPALRDAEVVYITDRLISMGHPYMQSSVDGDLTPARKLAAVGHLLEKRHCGKYMVWNLSEVEYDYSVLDDQVLSFQFPGSPSPPLGLMLKLLISMESWLKADEQNVVVCHCLTGKGRTSTVLAAFLCWIGEAGFDRPETALEYMARCKKCSVETLTIPSQRRYANYFCNMLDGVRPSQPPLILKRIIMSAAPKFGRRPQPPGVQGDDDDDHQLGCAPYLQMFKAGQLVFTTAASMSYNQTKDELPFCAVADGAISFLVENVVQGDVLIRCRHLTRKGQRVSMFRAAFHTGYCPPSVLRLTKAQLDGACTDKRFPDDFFVDLVFEPCDAETASKHLVFSEEEEEAMAHEGDKPYHHHHHGADAGAKNEAEERRKAGTVSGSAKVMPPPPPTKGGATVVATAYDSMLHRDSRFWDVIASHREEKMQHSGETPQLYGPTIGRRRDFSEPAEEKAGQPESASGKQGAKKKDRKQKSTLDTFSIGGDYDFLAEDTEECTTAAEKKEAPSPAEKAPPKRDELMEALMALDDEGEGKKKEVEEVVFDDGDDDDDLKQASPVEQSDPLKAAAKTEAGTKEEQADDALTPEKEKEAGADTTVEVAPTTDVGTEGVAAVAEEEENVTDMDALLAGAEDLDDEDYDLDLDDDDDELQDLENFLTKAAAK